MTRFNRLRVVRHFFEQLSQNKKVLVTSLLVCAVVTGFTVYKRYDWAVHFIKVPVFSLADALSFIIRPYFFGITVAPAVVYLSFHITKYSFGEQLVLREKSKQIIFVKQCGCLLLNSLFFTVCILLFTISVYVCLPFKTVMNWGEKASLYYALNESLAGVSFWQVLFTFFFSSCLILFFVQVFCLLLKWFTNKVVWGLVLILAAAAFESVPKDPPVKIAFLFASNNIELWRQGNTIQSNLLFLLLLCLLVFVLGLLFSERKDFLNAQQK